MRQILREHFGRGLAEDPIINDVWMTLAHKVRREHPKPEVLYVAVSPDRMRELVMNPRLQYVSPSGVNQLYGHPVYLDLELGSDEAGYRVVHLQ